MKRLTKALSLFALTCCAVLILYLCLLRDVGSAPQSLQESDTTTLGDQSLVTQAASGPLELPANESRAIEFSADESSFQKLTPREREDQYRDWLLFAAIAALQPSAEEYNRIFFD